MVSVCLPSDVLLQHLPSYLGRGVSFMDFSSRKFYLLQIIYNCNDQNLLDITSICMSVFSFLCLAHHRHTHTQIHAYVHIHLSAGKSVQSCEGFWGQESRGFGKSILRSLLFDVILPLKWLLIWNQELRVWMGDYKMLCRSFRTKNFFGSFWGLIGKKIGV